MLGDGAALDDGNGLGEAEWFGDCDGEGLKLTIELGVALGNVVPVGAVDGVALAEALAGDPGDAMAVIFGAGLVARKPVGVRVDEPLLHPPIRSASTQTDAKFRTGIVTLTSSNYGRT
jgi:hypothetical protein